MEGMSVPCPMRFPIGSNDVEMENDLEKTA